MLIFCFLDSPDPKRVNPPKTGSQKFARLPKFPHTQYDGELRHHLAFLLNQKVATNENLPAIGY